MIALDGSDSLKQNGFGKIQELAKNTLKRFKISESATHVGLMEFSKEVTPVLPLNELYDSGEIAEVIHKIKPSGGDATATDELLKAAASAMFAVPAGGRADAGKVLIVITDSKSTGKVQLKEAVKPAQDKGILVFVVDIGDETDPMELSDITPSNDEIKKVETPDDAPKIADKLADDIQRALRKSKFGIFRAR